MKTSKNTGIPKSGQRLIFCLILLAAPVFSSCEDDPMVDPKDGAKTGGSYGGRLALPDSTVQNTTSVPVPVNRKNPELF